MYRVQTWAKSAENRDTQHCGRHRALLNLLREANYVPRARKVVGKWRRTEKRRVEEKTMEKQVELVVGSCDMGYK